MLHLMAVLYTAQVAAALYSMVARLLQLLGLLLLRHPHSAR